MEESNFSASLRECGFSLEGKMEEVYCPDCAAKTKWDSVVGGTINFCTICGYTEEEKTGELERAAWDFFRKKEFGTNNDKVHETFSILKACYDKEYSVEEGMIKFIEIFRKLYPDSSESSGLASLSSQISSSLRKITYLSAISLILKYYPELSEVRDKILSREAERLFKVEMSKPEIKGGPH